MLGTFMKALSGNSELKLEEIAPFAEQHLPAGLPLVAVENLKTLQENGLPTDMRFGIATTNGQVIRQECRSLSMDAPHFKIVCESLNNFCPAGWKLVIPVDNGLGLDLPKIHRRAVNEIGTCYKVLRSFPGDDFAAYCLTNLTATARCRENPAIGQHWWTPLYYNVQELQVELTKALQEQLRINVSLPQPPEKFNVECLHFLHHGILIEDNWVVHFASCRVPDGANKIKLDSLDTFCDITPYAGPGGPCNYENDTEYKRILHRNRAVWILFHSKEWGNYNLFTNNCEHMSRACKVGRKQSAQVKNGVTQAALTALGLLVPGGLAARLAATLGITVVHKKLLPHIIKSLPTAAPNSNG